MERVKSGFTLFLCLNVKLLEVNLLFNNLIYNVMAHCQFTSEVMGNKTACIFKKVTKTVAICCVLLSMVLSVSAQQLSTYEQKRYELTLKTLEQFKDYDYSLGVAIGLLTAFKINADGNIGNDKLEEMYFAEGIIEACIENYITKFQM